VSVSLFEEEMLKLIERANNEDPRRVLEEAVKLTLTENLNKKVLEIVEHVLNIETELMKRLVEKAFAPQMTDVNPNRWGDDDPPERNDNQWRPEGRREGQRSPKRARCSRDFSKGGSFEKCCW
jgi:hypothetical protein